jgi:hypothetical protein
VSAKPDTPFEHAARTAAGGGVARELWLFVRHNKKWWLIPILGLLALFALIVLLSGTGAAPFIYTLF